ncbi:hypothetical protein V1508DRAFT_412476 [Lipomyces doorenjongii]|uniref:uncharacterized protein n=1 Tax=Lipomyces doorenjongii TaxID=383834 RepID=UPI0034CF55CE
MSSRRPSQAFSTPVPTGRAGTLSRPESNLGSGVASSVSLPDAPALTSGYSASPVPAGSSHNSSILSISPIARVLQIPATPQSASATPLPPTTKNEYPFGFGSDLEATSTPVINSSGTASGLQDADAPLSQADRLRLWRHDALMQHQYQTAVFIGDTVLSITDDPNDAFWLAQVHYNTGHYARARQLLMRQELDRSASCRYLAALCLTRLSKWDEALLVIGETNPFQNDDDSNATSDGGIKLEASMCYLRGIIYSNQNNFERAKDCYKEALTVDIKCYEAFDELITNSLMTPVEEWEFLSSLRFDGNEDGELVKLLYTTKLNKYYNTNRFFEAEQQLQTKYNLEENSDLIQSRGELLFVQCRFRQCLELCEKVLERDRFKFSIIPLYLACLHELEKKNKLFLIAHEMAENHPEEPVTWLTVGVYYLSIHKIAEARRFFSKASMMNPHFGAAWIGFAHTFAVEGEHEQAVSAYSTAARLFQGTHLPSLFLGMQHLQLHNFTLAEEYLDASYNICKTDPLLLNEMGVVLYHKNQLNQALEFFFRALKVADELDSDTKAWVPIKINLGHAFRQLRRWPEALEHFEEVLRVSKHEPEVYSAIGLVNLQLGRTEQAVINFQEALSLAPNDPVSWDLLKRALEENANSMISKNDG